VALAIDSRTKAGRIKNEPPNQVPQLPSTPASSSPVVTPSSHVQSPVQSPTPVQSPASSSPTDQVPVTPVTPSHPQTPTEVTDEVVLAYIQPHLAAGTTMSQLLQKMGHEKGKEWTAHLSHIADRIIELRNQRARPNTIYAVIGKDHGTLTGSLIAAMIKLRRSHNGSIVDSWKNEFLCSNPKVTEKVTTPETDRVTEKPLEGSAPVTNLTLADDSPVTSKSALNWLPLNPNDPEDIAIYIELVASSQG